jgi:uncharacterized protein YjbI with pentapeptide repeats
MPRPSDSDIMPDRSSGVAPNVSFGEMGLWLKSEQLARANLDRGAQRAFERAREQLIAAGGDPATIEASRPVPAPPPPDPEDLDAVAAQMTEALEKLEAHKQEALQIEARVAEATAKAAEALGRDPTDEIAEGAEQAGGPPKFSAESVLTTMRAAADEARAGGSPATEIEAQLADPKFREQLVAQQRALQQAYRVGAHLTPAAPPMNDEAARLARVVIQAARDSSESLAERDLTGADLRGVDLSGMDFARAFLEGADLRGANLAGANLEGAVLSKADLRGAKLERARLFGANLGGANLEGALLADADLSQAVLMRTRVGGATLSRAKLEQAQLMELSWAGADLRGARIDQAAFMKADLSEADFTGASLVQTTFVQCQIHRTNFEHANLHKATFAACKGHGARFARARLDEAVLAFEDELPDADFSDASCEKCCLRTTLLSKARFVRARMIMADLSECDARGAALDRARLDQALLVRTKLDGASLRGANLTEAVLSKSSIAGADFTGTQLTRADFLRAKGDDKTRFAEAVVKFTRFDKDGTARPA